VGNVKRAMLANPATLWFIKTDLDSANRYGAKMSPHNRRVPLVEPQQHVINLANPRRALDYRVEDRLHVRGRTPPNAQHLVRCRMTLQRLGELTPAILRLFD